MKAGEEMNEWWASQAQYWGEIKAKGYPLAFAGWDWPPFDILGDTLRGTHQILADMRRRPEQAPRGAGGGHAGSSSSTVRAPRGRRCPLPGSGSTSPPASSCPTRSSRSSTGRTSARAFSRWWRRASLPVIYWEADFESRLEHIADLPKGKIVYHLSNTNAQKARAVLGDTVCLMGNVPNIMLLSGTPDDVRAYCKKLIDTVGKNGGFIMDAAVHAGRGEAGEPEGHDRLHEGIRGLPLGRQRPRELSPSTFEPSGTAVEVERGGLSSTPPGTPGSPWGPLRRPRHLRQVLGAHPEGPLPPLSPRSFAPPRGLPGPGDVWPVTAPSTLRHR